MIGYQAIGPDCCARAPGCRGDQAPIQPMMVGREKHRLAPIAARCVTWWGKPGATTRAIRGMPVLPSPDVRDVHSAAAQSCKTVTVIPGGCREACGVPNGGRYAALGVNVERHPPTFRALSTNLWRANRSSGLGPCGMRATEINDDALYEMVNLVPRLTGLPMTIWASPRGTARHDVRIKVNRTHGRQMVIAAAATVGVRPAPRLIAGQLSPADLHAVSDWIRLNEAALVGYWDFTIDTDEFLQRLQPLSPPIPP